MARDDAWAVGGDGTVRVRSYEAPIILAEPGTVLIEIPDGRTIAVSLR